MSRARTYTKAEMSDAAAAAAMHNVRVIMHPSGEVEFAPKSFAVTKQEESVEDGLQEWLNGRKASRRA